MNHKLRIIVFIFIISACISTSAKSQTHFQPVDPTGFSYPIIITSIGGITLGNGDEIAVFDSLLCVGAAVYNGTFNIGFPAHQGIIEPEVRPGYETGHTILFRYWDADQNQEYYAVPNPAAVFDDGIYYIGELTVGDPVVSLTCQWNSPLEFFAGGSESVSGGPVDGVSPLTYSWTGDEELTITDADDSNPTFSGLAVGSYSATVTVQDVLMFSCNQQIEVNVLNRLPETPADPSPANGASDVSVSIDLTWSCSDPDAGDILTYDVYIDTVDTPATLVSNDQNGSAFTPSGLNHNTGYYWKIAASDNHGGTAEGPVWSFTTMDNINNPPNLPSAPNPGDSASDVSLSIDLTWLCSDPDAGDTLTYDVYLGTVNPPATLVSDDQNGSAFTPSGLNYNTGYYWKIAASDNHGDIAEGPVWSFTTMSNDPPYIPYDPFPEDFISNASISTDLYWSGGDPDVGDTVSYNVYFGSNINGLTLVIQNQSPTMFDPGLLLYGTTYYWKIVASDNHGESSPGLIWRFTTGPSANNAPQIPFDPGPEDEELGVSATSVLSWDCIDSDSGDTLSYDVYLSVDALSMTRVSQGLTETLYDPETLEYETEYFWRIVAMDNHQAQTPGPIWCFTVMSDPNNPPNIPRNPDPADSGIDVNEYPTLSWIGGDPNPLDVVTYEVYLGVDSLSMDLVADDQSAISFTPDVLYFETLYFWRIVATDNHDVSIDGPIWCFTTRSDPNLPPFPPTAPTPAHEAVDIDVAPPTLQWSGGDPDGDTVLYNVWFGDDFLAMTEVSVSQSDTTYEMSPLNFNEIYFWQIVATDSHGLSEAGPIWNFSTIVNYPPHTPSQPSPEDGEIDISTLVSLSWSGGDPDVGDTVSYNIYFGTENPPAGPVVSADTTYNPGSLSFLTTYYWQVTAVDRYHIAMSGPVWSFTTEADPNSPPYAPSNPNPADQAPSVPILTDLSWTGGDPDGDSVTYNLYFDDEYPPETLHGEDLSGTTQNPPQLNYETAYYWKIVATDDHGEVRNGAIWSFTTETDPNHPPNQPSNPDPANGVNSASIQTNLSWTGGDPDPGDIVSYDLYFGEENPPETLYSENLSGTTQNLPQLNYDTAYYWQIIATDNHGAVRNGDIWSFITIVNHPPYAPSNPYPSDQDSSLSIQSGLSWSSGDPDAGDAVSYDVYFDTVTPPVTRVAMAQSDTSFSQISLQYETLYYWRIVATDNHGRTTTGDVWEFFTELPPNDPPYTPWEPSPEDSSTHIVRDVTLSWRGGDPDLGQSVAYDLYVDTASPPLMQASAGQSDNSYALSGLDYSTTYYWQVVSTDNRGESVSGPIWNFVTELLPNQPPYEPTQPNPEDGAVGVTVHADIFWIGGDPDAGDEVSYRVFFGTTDTPDTPVSDNQSETVYDPGTLDFGVTYYWQIRASDNQSLVTTGPVWSFTTGQNQNMPPYTPRSPSPTNAAVYMPITTQLSWTGGDPNPGDQVTYDVYFGIDDIPVQLVGNDQSPLSFDPGELAYDLTYYWRIVATDDPGAVSPGPIWSFSTMSNPNRPPLTPQEPTPENGEQDVAIDRYLSWLGGDPDYGDAVFYDLYFGAGTLPTEPIISGQTGTMYDPDGLIVGTNYFWQIIATDSQGERAVGPVWNFSTAFPEIGSISGYLYVISRDDPLPGITVQAWSSYPGGQVAATTTTESNGFYNLDNLVFGQPYDIRAYSQPPDHPYLPQTLYSISTPAEEENLYLTPTPFITPTNGFCQVYCLSGSFYRGYPIQEGDVVTAADPQGTVCGQSNTVTDSGGYSMFVYGDDPTTTQIKEGAVNGELIDFFINGERVDVLSGEAIWQDLSLLEICIGNGINRTVSIPLSGEGGGWNLISWNVDAPNDSISVIFEDVMENIVVILSHDEDGSLVYRPNMSPSFSNMFTANHLRGYWVKVTQDDTLYVTGETVDPQTPLDLIDGWNLLSYLPIESDSTHHAIGSVLDQTAVVIGFDGEGMSYRPNLAEFSNLKLMKPGFGYWIRVSSSATLIYPE